VELSTQALDGDSRVNGTATFSETFVWLVGRSAAPLLWRFSSGISNSYSWSVTKKRGWPELVILVYYLYADDRTDQRSLCRYIRPFCFL